MEKRRLRLGKRLKKDFSLRILAIVLAVIIWFILAITVAPTIPKTIHDVPVTISLEGYIEEQGLAVIDFDEETTVDISISGMRYDIGSFTADDLEATLDTSPINDAGTYELSVKVKSDAAPFDVTSITPSTVSVKIDYIKTVTVPLQVRAVSVSAQDGYSLGDPVVTPEVIDVTGPQKLVDNISYAVFAIDQKQSLSEAYTTSSGKLILYSDDGAQIDNSSFVIDNEPISVTFPVYFVKNLKLKFDYLGVPSNFDTSTLKYSLSESDIDVMTSNESILNQDDLHLGYINLSEINLENSFTFDVNLDAGVSSVSGVDKVTVTFDSEGFASKEISIPGSNINIINQPNNQDITLSTRAIPSVTVYGPEDVIETLSADDLIAEFNMQSIVLDNGTYTRGVNIYAPKLNNVWCYGSYEIVFTVSEKKPETTVLPVVNLPSGIN